MAYVAGAYSADFGTVAGPIGAVVDIGRTEVGFEMVMRPSVNPIRADETGRVPVDGIFTGVEDIVIRFNGIEWNTTQWNAVIDFARQGGTEGQIEEAGSLMSTTLCDQLVITPITGEAAAIAGGNTTAGTYTFPKVFPLEPMRTVFSSQRLRSFDLGFYVFANAVVNSVATMYSASYS